MGREYTYQDLSGKRFGKLVVVSRAYGEFKSVKWLCECDCGKFNIITTASLICGNTKSCGCLRQSGDYCRTHGQSKSKLWGTWCSMRSRCRYPKKKDYKHYGGRGISVCEDWSNDFMTFYNWSLENGYREGLTIDRIDNDGNYEPSNCRWIPFSQQSINRRNVTRITIGDETNVLRYWCRKYQLNYTSIKYRLRVHPEINKAEYLVKCIAGEIHRYQSLKSINNSQTERQLIKSDC
jgi:hypothetical protein